MNVPVVSHLKLLVNLYNKMNNRFWVLLVIYLIIYLLSVLYKNKQIFCAILQVAPIVGAWIEIRTEYHSRHICMSLLSWERGLKYRISLFEVKTKKSLLSRERGLKY